MPPPPCKQNLYLTEFRVDSRTASLKDPANFYLIVEQVLELKVGKQTRHSDDLTPDSDLLTSLCLPLKFVNKTTNQKI